MAQEYELIAHNSVNFRMFLVKMLYRTPHIHSDYEIITVLSGALDFRNKNTSARLQEGDVLLINPLDSHEFSASRPALVLSFQIPAAFFKQYYQKMDHIEFDHLLYRADPDPASFSHMIHRILLEIGINYFTNTDSRPLRCAGLINQLFAELVEQVPYHIASEKEKHSDRSRSLRMREIIEYINAHFQERLTLSEIAEEQHLDLYYMSHLFKDFFGVPFQDYLAKVRCEHARSLLLMTDLSLLDISLNAGFSDPKYFTKHFQNLFGATPKQYRKQIHDLGDDRLSESVDSAQIFLSEQESLGILQNMKKEL